MHRLAPINRLKKLLNTERGLHRIEVVERLNHYGRNDIIEISTSAWWALFRNTIRDPMLWFLIGTALLFLFLGDMAEAFTLLAAIVPLVGMDLYLHHRTHASTESLKSRLATQARVLRDGEVLEIAATDIVPGDLVMLSAGESVPADGILIAAESAQMDESALTGESYPVRKQSLIELEAKADVVPVDIMHWAYAGSRLLTGRAAVRVLFTGGETLYGEIVRSTTAGRHERTPLQSAITHLVGVLLITATILCLVLAWVRLRQGFGLVDALLSAVTLAVAALPEEFPVVFTFFLGTGVYRLARRHALVRRAVVVENIGRISCICSDKTGTLTEGVLQLTHCYPARDLNETELLSVAARASRIETGDPLDAAVFRRIPAAKLSAAPLATFPFTEDRKRETAIWSNGDGTLMATTKGAPETIFAMCALTEQERSVWEARMIELAESGHKVVACAHRSLDASAWAGGEPDRGFKFAGLLAFEDPVREGVVDAIRQCRASGIHVLMVTGDHPLTAKAVAREIGLGEREPNVIDASRLTSQLQFDPEALKKTDVIARAVPAQKLHIVRALQSIGEIVAVTGDGVNDVPALQAADIGLAMGERGTRSAREAAAIVLLDDNFHTITRTIAEGRQLFHNLKLSFAYLLIIHIPLVLTAMLIPLVGHPLLYLPIHIVWLELIIHPTALLVFQGLPASEQLSQAQGTYNQRFFNRRQWIAIACAGFVITLMIIGGYEYSLGIGRDVEHARAMTMIMLSFVSVMVTVILSGLSTRLSQVIVSLTLLISMLFVQTPHLAYLLHLKPLHLDDLLISATGALGIAAIVLLGGFSRRK